MNAAASGRTWEDASSPAALRLTRNYEEAWQQARRGGRRLEPDRYLADLRGEGGGEVSGARLAVLRADLALRWESGEKVPAQHYLDRFPDLGEDTKVALVYEEYCLREDDGQKPTVAEFLSRYAALEEPLRRVLDIHQLIGSTTASHSMLRTSASASGSRTLWPGAAGSGQASSFPESGQTIGGFYLVEELGRGAFGRVFLARERQLADRPVALKVTRRGSREPQALARLQHTHIVPVHSHGVDQTTGLHLLCMPYFGRITLSRVLTEVALASEEWTGATLVQALDRLVAGREDASITERSGCRAELARRTFTQAIAWWGARLAEALEHAHDRGVLHRDIKPSNVLVIEDGMPMLLDFNLARESVSSGQEETEPTLGGTVDYMAPEHLEALAEGLADGVDRRSDLFELGVLLFEAVSGRKPFRPPAKGRSMIDALLRLAVERRRDPSRLLENVDHLTAPMRAVIRRCLEPDPEDRYQFAGQLAADLRAVADDLPLRYAREPLASRLGRGLRRNRRRVAVAALVLAAATAVLGARLDVNFDRQARYRDIWKLYDEGVAAVNRGDFNSARTLLDNAMERASQQEPSMSLNLLRWTTIRNFPEKLSRNLEQLWADPGLEDLQGRFQIKAKMAKVIGNTRDQADRLLARSEDLRFRLLGLGNDLPGAVAVLKKDLEPFYVLNSKHDWNDLQHIWGLLDDERAARLKEVVNELLFLWMAGVERSWHEKPVESTGDGARPEPEHIAAALEVCDRALTFAEPREPWLAVRALLEGRTAADGGSLLPGEPVRIERQTSARACFQWGLLCSGQGRRERAIRWLQRAVWIDWSNYWYQFCLGYLEDQAGLTDDALAHYSAAVVGLPESSWLRFSRARLYRVKGRWSWALDDLNEALRLMGDAPQALAVLLEIGVLHQAVGNFSEAEKAYGQIIKNGPQSEYARAARFNLANIAAESGREPEALSAYGAIIANRPGDVSARFSRALLLLRLDRPEEALGDLDRLVRDRAEISSSRPGEVRATRALANLRAGKREAAANDAAVAMRAWPSPANERLLQRTLLAAGRYDELQFQRPEEFRLLPESGGRLTADLRAAVEALSKPSENDAPAMFRALLNRSLMLCALGRHQEALRVADSMLERAALSPQARLIRGRVRLEAADPQGALIDVEQGLKLLPNDAGLRELRGRLLAAAGHREAALAELDLAILQAPSAPLYVAKAEILEAAGEHDRALYEWSHALQRDPTLAPAYLGRARCFVALGSWERALADLEQATTWVGADPRLQGAILLTYIPCLREHPEYGSRFRLLLGRAARQVWERLGLDSPTRQRDAAR